jgi:hypothetical protein
MTIDVAYNYLKLIVILIMWNLEIKELFTSINQTFFYHIKDSHTSWHWCFKSWFNLVSSSFFISGLLYFWLVIFNYNFESFQFFLNFPIIRFLCLNMNFKAFHHCMHNLILINLILQLIDGIDKFRKLLNKLKHLFDVL